MLLNDPSWSGDDYEELYAAMAECDIYQPNVMRIRPTHFLSCDAKFPRQHMDLVLIC